MTRTSKLYPFKIKSQCEKAIAILQKDNDGLMRTSECVSAFVNDTEIESISFEQLQRQCSNYIKVIESIINVNNMDIADYQTLSNAVGSENLEGNRILNNQEKYIRLRDNKYLQESNFRSMAATCLDEAQKKIFLEEAESCRYFGDLYDDMYQYWLEKERLFDSIEASTCVLFIESVAVRESLNSCLGRLSNSFNLYFGYNPSTVIPEKLALEYIEKGDIDTANGIKALREYLSESEKFTEEESAAIIKGILEQSPECLRALPNIISVAGTEAGIANMEEMINKYAQTVNFIYAQKYINLSFKERNLIDNIEKLEYSEMKKMSLRYMGITLLDEGYDIEFTVGTMANCYHESDVGVFEDMRGDKYQYWIYMNENFDYNNKFSLKSISEIGIQEYAELLSACEKVSQQDIKNAKFGIGTFQWTEHDRVVNLLACYNEVCGENNYPTIEQCCYAEALITVRELDGTYMDNYYKTWVTDEWKKKTVEQTEGIEGAKNAAKHFCLYFEGLTHTKTHNERAETAGELYRVLVGE